VGTTRLLVTGRWPTSYIPAGEISNKTAGMLLAYWDDFRTANWLEIIEYLESVMQQAQQLLTIAWQLPHTLTHYYCFVL